MADSIEMRTLGNTGMRVSVLGFGTAELGYGGVGAREVGQVIGSALDRGLNLVDTAECYGNGEEVLGQAIGNRRRDFYLMTKCGHPGGMRPGDWRRGALLESIENSLKRLRTDVLDGVFLHSCDEETLRKGDAIAALAQAKSEGKARFIGYSGDGPAARYAIGCGAFDLLEISLSIADQEAIDSALPQATAKGMGVVVKRPIANAAWTFAAEPANPYVRPYWERLRKLDYDFMRTPEMAEIALRFTLGTPGVHTAIVGSTKPSRWQSNAALVAAGPLPAQTYAAIRARWKERAGADWVGQM